MTDVRTQRPGPSPGAAAQPPVSRRRAREQRAATGASGRPPRSGTWLYALATLAFLGGLGYLSWQGWQTTKQIKGGSELEAETDPAKPGYQAQVKPTPTRLLGQLRPDGRLSDLVLLVEGPANRGGAVMFIPSVTVVEGESGARNLERVFEEDGWPAVVDAVGRFLGEGFTDASTVTSEQVRSLFEPIGTLQIDNPDTLVVTNGASREIRYPAGALTLDPAAIIDYTNLSGDGESEINRAVRAQLVWEAWMKALAERGESALPRTPPVADAEARRPIDVSAAIAGLAAGFVSFQQLPLEDVPVPGAGGFRIYRPEPARIAELMPKIVPFPTSAFPGQRPRVRLLNGTTARDLPLKATGPIVAAGGELVILGNADRLDLAASRVEYHNPRSAEAAAAMAKGLGLAEPAASTNETDAYDVTVTLGADFRG